MAIAAAFTVGVIVVRLLAVLMLPIMIALGTAVFGRGLRMAARLLLTVPLALYAPTVLAAAWQLSRSPAAGGSGG